MERRLPIQPTILAIMDEAKKRVKDANAFKGIPLVQEWLLREWEKTLFMVKGESLQRNNTQ